MQGIDQLFRSISMRKIGPVVVAFLFAGIALAQGTGTARASSSSNASAPPFNTAVTVAPTLSWITGTQDQTVWGGSALLSTVRSSAYCDHSALGFGLNATASDSKTTKSGGTPTYLNSNDVKASVSRAIGGPNYLGANADFFDNNSLGIGLQQTYAAQYQFDFGCLSSKRDDKERRVLGSLGIGAGFMSQRLYETQSKVNGFVLPLSGQLTVLIGGGKGTPPKLIWYALAGFVPDLTDTHAYQISTFTALQIPTGYKWLTVSLADTNLYANNAPMGHKRNYQNGNVSLIFSFPPKKPKPAAPPGPEVRGACYGGDKLQRLYCYQDVTEDACSSPNIFRANTHCSSAGFTPALQ